MKDVILSKIKAYHTIIIHRHLRPDLDAIGSQMGLKFLLERQFPDKKICVVGDLNTMSYLANMDEVTDEMYKDALVIITDVAVSHMISDDRYLLGKEIIIIDHHENDTDVENVSIHYKDTSFNSACEMIIDIAKTYDFHLSKDAATYLYGGMVTDSGRFLYLKNPERTFLLASYVSRFEPNIQDLYNYLYTETLSRKVLKNQFSSFELTKENVAYRINSKALIESTGEDFQSISRGMVNQMSGIKEVLIWGSFSEDQNGSYVAELRSRDIPIVDVAKKYGGGGHLNACGATLENIEKVYQLIEDLNEKVKQHDKHSTRN
ncbi:MAG: bifunctional oligoribonuclease/PAP phosphatase NrnA [Firmicutes bacterium]|nr:bifunctional oligoribonuclease/PAP phosphatase NrnA [Bacillota bacterium]